MPPLSATVGRFLFGDRVRALVAVCAVFVIAMLAYERGRQSVRVSAAHIADAEYSRGGLAACTACEVAQAMAKHNAARRAWWLSGVEDVRMSGVGPMGAVEARLVKLNLEQEMIQPTFVCPDQERPGCGHAAGPARRIGGVRGILDGGKWVCGLSTLKKPCVVYSCGSSGDFSFETAVHERAGCEIHTFDKDAFPAPPFVSFHQYKIGGGGGDGTHSLSDLMSELGHTSIDVFKVDIEGGEWALIPAMLRGKARPSQLLMEVHTHDPGRMRELLDMFLELDKAGYRMFYKEPNVEGGGNIYVEYSFVRV